MPTCWVPAPEGGASAAEAKKGERTIWTPGGPRAAGVYDRARLTAGNVVEGPAIVEAVDTTVLVPDWARLTIDRYGSAVIEERS